MPVLLRWFLTLGPTNPIAHRLVLNGGRRTKHMWIRSAYLGVLIIVLLWSLLMNTTASSPGYRELAAAAAKSFEYIAYLQITLICVLAPVFMGGAIAQEASPRTWEVLLTTPLSPAQIVLGNLLGRLFFVLSLLICSMPLFALTQYFGGVPGRTIFASYAVACGAAFLVGSIAIALAVSRLAGKRAFFAFYALIISYLGVTIAVDSGLRSSGLGAGATGQGVTVMTSLNPFLALSALLNPSSYPRALSGSQVWPMSWMLEAPVRTWCVGASVVSLFFVIASAITVRAGGLQTFGAGEEGVPLMQRLFKRKVAGDPNAEGRHRAPRAVWTNPIAWREAASRNSTPLKIALRWTFLSLGLLWAAGLVYAYHKGTITGATFRVALASTVAIELIVTTLVAINTAATAISKEREEGTLDLLLTTPISAKAYILGKLRGLVMYLLPLLLVPLGSLLIAGLYQITGGLGRSDGATIAGTPVVLPEGAIVGAVAIVPFMAFCVMLGLQWSLKSKGTIGATVATVGIVGVVSGILGMCAWNAAKNIPGIGPALASLSPAATVYSIVYPEDAVEATIKSGTLESARLSLVIGAIFAAAAYAGACYAILTGMVRTFDVTVRKLAGAK